ncbi:269_t:CDS:2, partial [Dentiscutata erythropus]
PGNYVNEAPGNYDNDEAPNNYDNFEDHHKVAPIADLEVIPDKL